jgi:glycosyltransferase involved in cell wall biosynthesis
MPVYNEIATVEQAIQAVLDTDLGDRSVELIVVDDGSTDGTRELLQARTWEPGRTQLVLHDRNMGKGAAVRTALAEASGTYAAVFDADLEYSTDEFAPMLRVLEEGIADAVFGVRGFEAHSAFSFWYVVGNKAVTFAANLLYNSWISDMMTCHKMMRTELFRQLPLRERGFGIEPEITAHLLRRGIRIYEVPVTYRARSREAGKKLTAMDGLRVVWTLARCRVA